MSDQNPLNYEPIPLGNLASRPGLDLLPPPLPKPALPVEPRSTLPKAELPAVKSAALIEAPKPPLPGRLAWVPEAMKALVKPSRQKGVIAAGLASLAVGVGVANLMWPAPVVPPGVEMVKTEPAPLPSATPEPKALIELPSVPESKALIELPAVPAMKPPTVVESAPPVKLELPPLELPKVDVNVKPAGGMPDVPLPSPGSLPPIVLPTADAKSTTVAIAPPPVKLPDVTAIPLPGTVVKPAAPVTPPSIPEVKITPPSIPEIKSVAPPVAAPELPAFAPSVPKSPGIPEVKTPAATIPATTIPTTPIPAATVPEVKVTPPAVTATPEPRSLPKAEPVVRPAAGMAPREDYDVDVHYAAAGDTWSSISRQHLGDDRFADALKAYNSGRVLNANQSIDIPPIHVLRRQFGNLIGSAPRSEPRTELPPAGDGQRTFEVPAGGMSFKDVARKALGDENYWGRIWELNPKLRTDEPIPAGTRIVLPAEARIGN